MCIRDRYNQLADDFYRLIDCISNEVPEDRIVYVIMHEDVNEFGDIGPKTIGKQMCIRDRPIVNRPVI